MKRTKLLQEIRNMRFEEIYGDCLNKRISQEEAGRLLGVCELNMSLAKQIGGKQRAQNIF